MRTSRALAVTAAAGAIIGLAAPSASAWDGSAITVSPTTSQRGGTVTVTVDAHECTRGNNNHVSSSAFPRTRLRPSGGNMATATVKISRKAHIGAHSVTATCGAAGSVTREAALTVIHGGVRGGVGGSSSMGATSTDVAIGGSLVGAAAIGGGVFWLRRRGETRTGRA
ncbi:hypothetical protein QIS99_23840 [Streptomyces sp. B-S-A8]|uniref:Integral membrane protein n=1 Tax=Streptomyces solicavernae TaxID=3043614 RepID=A0ABT6RY01_9ACTN|nr:hypothetical protein [Streptomyces sp. B-S-A8]MDI3389205.1 hypothetical protein [Streptomyces sp. B-S-A8]